MKTFGIIILLIGITIIMAFTRKKQEFAVVNNFKLENYLGKWYEIARLDYKWEKNLNNVTANYSRKDNGMIKVDNRGYDQNKKKWKESIGKAKFAGDSTQAKIKVSFFGPFYSDYNVVALDEKYQYALVLGKNTKYMWILSRTTTIPETVKNEYLAKAKSLGVKTDELVWVEHTQQ